MRLGSIKIQTFCSRSRSLNSNSRGQRIHSCKTTRLPNGQEIAYVSKDEVAFLYNEIFEDRCYLKHGLKIHPGDTVLDIGANIGLFTLFAAKEIGPKGHVIAVEPLPEIHAALKQNAELRKIGLKGEEMSRISVLEKGLNSGDTSYEKFTYYPHATGWSTMLEDEGDVKKSMEVFLKRALSSGHGIPNTILAKMGRILVRILPEAILVVLLRAYTSFMMREKAEIVVPMTTVTQILEAHGLERVHLLKIDVERAELSVLEGISNDTWTKLDQVVVEVHGTNSLSQLQQRFQERSFQNIDVEQNASLLGTDLYTMFARRY